MLIVTENQPYIFERAAELTGSTGWATDAEGVMLQDDEGAIAFLVFQNRTDGHADLHIATQPGRVLTMKALDALLRIAFQPEYYGLQILWVPIPENNVRAQRTALSMGFRFETRRRGYAAGGQDVILMAMRLDDILAAQKVLEEADAEAQAVAPEEPYTDPDDTRPQDVALHPEGTQDHGRQQRTEP